jgi:hypothetical protein
VLRSRRGSSKSGFKGAKRVTKRPKVRAYRPRKRTYVPRKWKLSGSLTSARRRQSPERKKRYSASVTRRKRTDKAQKHKSPKATKNRTNNTKVKGLSRQISAAISGSGQTEFIPPGHLDNAIKPLFFKATHSVKCQQGQEQQPIPFRPIAHGGMCEQQRIDLAAAQAGKMSWDEYYRKWSNGGLSL